MATTMFFEKTIQDATRPGNNVDFEIGRSSYLGGENLIYMTINGKSFILDEATGRELFLE